MKDLPSYCVGAAVKKGGSHRRGWHDLASHLIFLILIDKRKLLRGLILLCHEDGRE